MYSYLSQYYYVVGILQQGMPDTQVPPFLNWTILWSVYVLTYLILWPLVIKYIFRLDFSAVANIDLETMVDKDMRMTKDQKFGLGCLVVFIL